MFLPSNNRRNATRAVDRNAIQRFQLEERVVVRKWKPASFSKVASISLIIVTTGLLTGVITLQLIDKRASGIIFAAATDNFSSAHNFAYQYSPTILIVAFGMWISILDLDIKRLDPWSRLSGSRDYSSCALFCRYDSEFVLTAIYKAIKARHWNVVYSSFLMILVVIIIPAVQNSMFTTTTRITTHKATVGVPQGIVNTSAQTHTMTNNFLVTAYSIAWLGQSEPSFTTESYTLAPFDTSAVKDPTRTFVTTSTIRYWSEVDCWEPDSVTVNTTSRAISFADGRGCQTTDVFSDAYYSSNQQRQYAAVHIPVDSPGFIFENRSTRATNVTSMCPGFSNRFLTIWWKTGSNPDFRDQRKALALFCDTNYYKEPVMARIMVANKTVVSFSTSGPREVLTPEEFNMIHFKRTVNDGSPPNSHTMNGGKKQMALDINEGTAVENERRTQVLDFNARSYPAGGGINVISWLLALAPSPTAEYLSSSTLARSYNQTYRRLFALAMGHNFAPNSQEQPQNVDSEVLQEALTIVPVFLYLTEALLVIALIFCLLVAWQIAAQRLELNQNPDCLAQVLDLARSSAVQNSFMAYSGSSESEMVSKLNPSRFKLAILTDGRPGLCIYNLPSASPAPQPSSKNAGPHIAKDALETSWMAMISAIVSILAVTISLYVMENMSKRNNGIPLPKSNAFTVQLALSFTPTLLATLLGYYIAAMCRVNAFMKPMADLKKRRAGAKNTLLAKYTSLPPALLFPQAFRLGHYILALLSLLALLSNLLTISMAGLFMQYDASLTTALNITHSKKPFLDLMQSSAYILTNQQDSIYTVSANQSGLTRLPTWTTTEHGYLPVEFGAIALNAQNPEVEYESTGYGADLDCFDLLTANVSQDAQFTFVRNNSVLFFEFCYGYPEGNSVTCNNTSVFHWGIELVLAQVPDFGVAAYEFQTTVSRPNSPTEESSAWNSMVNEQQIVLAWLRGRWARNSTVSSRSTDSTSPSDRVFEYNATIIACRPRLKTQNSVIRVDLDGNILSADHKGQPDYSPSLNLTNTLRNTISAVALKNSDSTIGWHTGVIVQDWPNYLYRILLGSGEMVDPKKPVPTVEFAAQIASKTFGRLFAAQLFLDRRYLRPANSTSQNATRAATLHHAARRFKLSPPMYIITQTILMLALVVLFIYRVTLPRPFLPREPFTIASQIAYAAASHVIDDVAAAMAGSGNGKRARPPTALLNYRFGYGKYVGKDGKTHTGIEREPFVQNIN